MRRLRPLALACCLLLAGCGGALTDAQVIPSLEPSCRHQDQELTAQVLLMAQAVPTATQLPCVELLPAGWVVSDVFVRNGRARFTLDSDRVGSKAVEVVLQRYCTFGKVSRVPTDHPGTRRFHEVLEIRPGERYRGAVHYLFRGGCVSYRLDFRGDEQARPLGEVTLALGFVSRDAVAASLAELTDGRLQLDPPAQER